MQILTNLQEKLIRELSKTNLKDKFFLTGGTALSAFYLQHRYSEEYWLCQAIKYINDLTVLPRMIKPVTLDELRDFFNQKIKLLMSGL